MKEIKFRVCDLDSNDIIGYEWLDNNGWCSQEVNKPKIDRHQIIAVTAKRELFTGFLDRKLVDIYDNDIVKNIANEDIGRVVWLNNDGWRVKVHSGDSYLYLDGSVKFWEVISV